MLSQWPTGSQKPRLCRDKRKARPRSASPAPFERWKQTLPIRPVPMLPQLLLPARPMPAQPHLLLLGRRARTHPTPTGSTTYPVRRLVRPTMATWLAQTQETTPPTMRLACPLQRYQRSALIYPTPSRHPTKRSSPGIPPWRRRRMAPSLPSATECQRNRNSKRPRRPTTNAPHSPKLQWTRGKAKEVQELPSGETDQETIEPMMVPNPQNRSIIPRCCPELAKLPIIFPVVVALTGVTT